MIALHIECTSDLDFFASRFVEHWYRGDAHLARDLERFASTYRVPQRERSRFRDAVRAALADAPSVRRAG